MTALLAAALLAAAVLVPPKARVPSASRPARTPSRARPAPTAPTARLAAAATAGLTVAVVLGGVMGVVIGLAGGAAVARALPRLASRADLRRRALLAGELPLAADLLAAAVLAGTPLPPALLAVGRAIDGPLGTRLTSVARALELGAPPREAWAPLADDPVTAALAAPLVRASERGTPPSTALTSVSGALRREAHDRAMAAAEVAAVRAVGPLGACFLPAFVLLGVVPLVVALMSSLLAS